MHNRHWVSSWLLVISFALVACGQTPPADSKASSLKPQAEALYQQCESLKTGSADVQALTRDIESLKSAEVKMRIQVAERLAHGCDQRAVTPLTRMLKDDKD